MKFVKDEDLLEWLLNDWRGELDWDEHNTLKLAKHDVNREAIESLFEHEVAFIGKILEPEGVCFGEYRHLILGVVYDGRYFAVVFTAKMEICKLRPISCRRMRKEEKKSYDESKKIRLR